MSVLQTVQTLLCDTGLPVYAGKYTDTAEMCGKIVFAGKEKPVRYLGRQGDSEAFKIIVRGSDYIAIENMLALIKNKLSGAGYIQTIGYEDIAPKNGETFLQIAVTFESK